MLGRRQRSAVSPSAAVEAGSTAVGKTAETVSELAGRAVEAAREAQRVAAPALRSAAQEAQRVAAPALRSAAHTSAETLSHAAEKAAEVLSEAAERLAKEGAEGVTTAATGVAAAAVRPKRWRRRIRRVLILGGAVGAAYMVITKTPIAAKLSELVFGPPLDEEEPEPITLPVTGSPVEGQGDHSPVASESEALEPAEDARGEEVASGSASQDDGTGQ